MTPAVAAVSSRPRVSAIARWLGRPAVGLALAAVGCSLEPDVVAEPATSGDDVAAEGADGGLSDAGARPLAPTSRDAGLAAPNAWQRDARADALVSDALTLPLPIAQKCTAAFLPVMLATKLGRPYGYDPGLPDVADYGVPTCLQNGYVRSATVDKDGRLWVSWASDGLYAIQPGTPCGMPVLASRAFDAMAFVHSSRGSTLYALEAGRLVTVDPASLEVRTIGELNANHLVADPFGSLFAVRQDDEGAVHVEEIDLADASIRPVWTTLLPASGLAGVARLTRERMWLFSSTRLYQLDWLTGETKEVGPITDVELEVYTVAASSCDPG